MLLPDAENQLSIQLPKTESDQLDQEERGVAEWVYINSKVAGLNTDTLPGAQGVYLPLATSQGAAGVLGVYPSDSHSVLSPDQLHLLETFANQTALAIERTRLAKETEKAHIQIETERQRNNLLSSISHDLRTPLASITGAVSSLLENDDTLDASNRRELAQLAYEEAARLNRQIGNLLDMTRLESGAMKIAKEWQSLEEIVGTVLNHLPEMAEEHPILISLPPDLPLVPCDALLIGQVFANLLENAIKYTPADTPIEINAASTSNAVMIEVADHGAGLPAGTEQQIFNKFYRADPTAAHGIGLGLTICRSIIEAHSGRIWAENRPEGGAVFRFTLPVDSTPPTVETEDG
jgi:two-component system sensor histidine kinase KdpD